MIVQCEACETRFRLADEKIKPGGTKVRCSKCKEVFTVTLPEPEAVEEAVDFDFFNMEKVTEDVTAGAALTSESLVSDSPEPEEQPASEREPDVDDTPETSEHAEGDDLDFSALESAMDTDTGAGEELADHFSFADTSRSEGIDFGEEDPASAATVFSPDADPTDFGSAFEETEEPGDSIEFDFSEEDTDSTDSKVAEPAAFSFDSVEDEPQAQDKSKEFSFEGDTDNSAFSFDEVEEEATPAAAQEYSEPGEFSFDEDANPFGDDSASKWSEESAGDDQAFNFDEPKFDNDQSTVKRTASGSEEDGLQFGEIDFSSDSDGNETPAFQSDVDFSKATMPMEREPEPFSQSKPVPPPPARDSDGEPLPAPPPPRKKSALSRILVLLVILLLGLGGAAGYLFMQEGSLSLNIIVKYLPFLQQYIGGAPVSAPGDRIGINIAGSSYVTGKAGQLLVIQGAAVNNHSTTRSAITVKGSLLNAKGQSLLQQTVFCGNRLDDVALKSMTFAAIEEAMNNQFGEGLSNMNVAAKATIPFTIVFHNLPAGIANINVEVVDSKPGAS